MTDEQLQEALKSMGKECFVDYYHKFCDLSLSTDDIAQAMLDDKTGWSTILNRVSNGRRIVNAGRTRDALTIIVGSRASAQARQKAGQYLDELEKEKTE